MALGDAAVAASRSWSGSPIGYHSRVYYGDLAEPPPGAHFSSEWGFTEAYSNPTQGDWREYAHRDVVAEVRRRAGNPDLSAAREVSKNARDVLGGSRADIKSILSAYLKDNADDLIEELRDAAEKVMAGTEQQYSMAVLPTGQIMSRDMKGITDGVQVAPHFAVHAEVLALEAPFTACRELAQIADRASKHIGRLSGASPISPKLQGEAVFIGHGRSSQWRELKDFIQDRAGLPWEEFNRVPVAGVTNIARLQEMLDASGIAFLVLTAEDEQADGSLAARQNVIHEAGLFQGRLGFMRAIVLLEEGCEEFSNIQGLGQIRFPAGRISAAFEEVRQVLEREGFLAG
jgi:predicted nucleotide-binding protein